MNDEELETLMRGVVARYAARSRVNLPVAPLEVTKHNEDIWEIRTNAKSPYHNVIAKVNPKNKEVLESRIHWGELVPHEYNLENYNSHLTKFGNKVAEILGRTLMLFGWRPDTSGHHLPPFHSQHDRVKNDDS